MLQFNLYGVRDKKTGELVKNITSPSRKFWEKKETCETALKSYVIRYEYLITEGSLRGKLSHPDDLEIVEITCYEKPEAMKIVESILPFDKMRYFTKEEQEAHNRAIEEMSEPIIGEDGKPINLLDYLDRQV